MEWRRTEARIVTMLHTCHVTPVHHWRLRLIESELRRAIEMKPAPPIVTATGVDRRTREEWHWQMQCRHLELMELEQSFRVLFEPDPTNVDADPSTTLELTIEQPHVPPQNPRETAEQQLVSVNLQLHTAAESDIVNVDAIEEPSGVPDTTVELTIEQSHVQHQNPGDTTEQQDVPASDPVTLQLPATVESDLSSPILIQHSETLLTEVSPAQSQSELMDDEEACVVDDIDAHYGFSVLGVLPTDRPPPEPGQEFMDKEACAVNATGADDVLLVRRACAGITESTIDAFPAPSQVPVPFQVRKKHELAIEDPMGGYAHPVPQLVPTNRAPPKPGEAAKLFAYGSITTTWRTIKVKACRSGQERRKGGAAIRTRSRWYWRGRQSCKKGHVTVWDMAVRIREHVVVRTGKPYLYYLRETLHV